MTNMDIVFTNKYATAPTRGSEQAAGWDLYAAIQDRIPIYPHAVQKIDTGIAMAIPEGYFGALYPRSGLSTKEGLRLANCVGVIDSDYRGPVLAPIYNDSDNIRYVEPGERIVQLVIQPYENVHINVVDAIGTTARGEGGFGSTGK